MGKTKRNWKRKPQTKAQRFAKWMEGFGSVSHRPKSERMYPDDWRSMGEVVAFRLSEEHPATFWALFERGEVTAVWPVRDVLEPLIGLARDVFERRVWRTRVLWHSDVDARPDCQRYFDVVRDDSV